MPCGALLVYCSPIKIDREAFLDSAARILEVASVTPETDFRAGPLWDSLTAFALRVMISQKCGKELSGADLAACRTVGDLMSAAGVGP